MATIILFASGSAILHDRAIPSPFASYGRFAALADPNGFNGTVTDSVTTLPIKDANVTAGNVFDLTDSNGHYVFDIAPGNYTVSVKRLGYLSQSKNATVLVNMTTTVNFALVPNPAEMGFIQGNVTDATTTLPIANASIEVDGFSTQTNATGKYKIQVPAPQNYSVTASKDGYIDRTVNNVSVRAGNTTTLNIALSPVPPPVGTLEGNVTDVSTHMPIEDAIIMAGNKSEETNSSGRYRIELSPGIYNVTASKNGYVNQTKTGIVITAGNVTALNFALVEVRIPVTAVIHPRSLNLRSEGRWITASIEFEEGFDARNANVSTIKLNNTIPVDLTAPMEFNGSMLTVKFDREAVETFILNALGEPSKFNLVALTLTGKLMDGTTFIGNDTIKTIFNMAAKEV